MLGLKLATDPRWVNLAEKSIEEILTDHAYCEQKATSSNIALIQLYPEKQWMVDKLVPVVQEEWMHFKLVLDELKKRGMQLAAAQGCVCRRVAGLYAERWPQGRTISGQIAHERTHRSPQLRAFPLVVIVYFRRFVAGFLPQTDGGGSYPLPPFSGYCRAIF